MQSRPDLLAGMLQRTLRHRAKKPPMQSSSYVCPFVWTISSGGIATAPEKANPEEKKEGKKRRPPRPEHKLENHGFDTSFPLISRCRTAPDFIIKSIRKTNNIKPYLPYSLNDKEHEQIKQDLLKLPERFRKVMKERLAGIYFVENFWARGIMASFRNEEKKMYTYFIIKPIVLEDNISG